MPLTKIITSLTNTSVKKVVALRERKERDQTGLMIIEGVREVAQALKAGVELKEVYLCGELLEQKKNRPIVQQVRRNNAAVIETNKEVFLKMAYGQRAEGILAVGRQPQKTLAQISFKNIPFLVIVERIEKPGNLGAILRGCDGAGVDGLIICDGQTDVYNPNVVRASLGTVFSVPVIQSDNKTALDFLKAKEIKIYTTRVDAQKIYTKANYRIPLALVLGSEEEGVSEFWKKHSHAAIKIPMLGVADSLNVSAAAAILVYEALRQRNGN